MNSELKVMPCVKCNKASKGLSTLVEGLMVLNERKSDLHSSNVSVIKKCFYGRRLRKKINKVSREINSELGLC